MIKSEIITSLKPVLKAKGFKKIRNYWYKPQNEMIFYLNVQGSAYCPDDFYVNLGIVLDSFQDKIPPVYEWDVCRRIFVDGKQTNFDVSDILLTLDFFLALFPKTEDAKIFIQNQKKEFQRIVISDRYILG